MEEQERKRVRKLPPLKENPKTNVKKVVEKMFEKPLKNAGKPKKLLAPIQKSDNDPPKYRKSFHNE